MKMAVNLSGRQFEQQDVVQTVARVLEETGLDASWLELEVTESMVVNNVQRAMQVLQQLRELGIAIALDDFGTGYCSLTYLKNFPITTIKIDRSFIQDVTDNLNSAAITQAIIALAHSLHLEVLADGVETEKQMAYLKTHACEKAQGYFISRPLPANRLVQLLEDAEGVNATLVESYG